MLRDKFLYQMSKNSTGEGRAETYFSIKAGNRHGTKNWRESFSLVSENYYTLTDKHLLQ